MAPHDEHRRTANTIGDVGDGGVAVQLDHARDVYLNSGTAPLPEPVWDIRTDFFGDFVNHQGAQERLLGQVRDRVLAGRPAVTYLYGSAGAGKTTLALEVSLTARRLIAEAAGTPPFGLYVDLDASRAQSGSGAIGGAADGTGGADPAAAPGVVEEQVHLADALGEFLRRLHLPAERIPEGLQARRSKFHEITSRHATVIIVDGVVSGAEVAAFEPGPGSLLIATGRSFVTSGPTAPHKDLADRQVPVIRLPGLGEEHALELLRGFDAGGGPLAALIDAPEVQEKVRLLIQRCGGLPQLLRIVGAFLAGIGDGAEVAAVAERLSAAERIDTELALMGGAPEAGPSVEDLIALGVRHLSEEAAELYVALGESPGTEIPVGLAAALLGSAAAARRALAELVGRCLVARDGGGHRWEPVMRADARTRSAARPDAERIRDRARVLDFYAAAFAHADRSVAGRRGRVTADRGDTAADRISGGYAAPFGAAGAKRADAAAVRAWVREAAGAARFLLRTARDLGRTADALLIAESLWPFLHDQRQNGLAAEVYRCAAEDAAYLGDPQAEARMRNYRGRALLDAGDPAAAEDELAAALDCAERSGDAFTRAAVLETRALLHHRTGRRSEAVRDITETRQVHDGLGNVRGTVLSRYQLGLFLLGTDAAHAVAELEAAEQAAAAELELHPDSGDWRSLYLRVAVRLGEALLAAGGVDRALGIGVYLVRELGSDAAPLRRADALSLVARAARTLGSPDAQTWGAEALRIYSAHHVSAPHLRDDLGF
ncbi:hypothetical protein [Nocardiopsis coralliicola]